MLLDFLRNWKWGNLPREVPGAAWFPAPCETPWLWKQLSLARGYRRQELEGEVLLLFVHIFENTTTGPQPHTQKNCQQSHLYYIHFNEYFVEVFPHPQAACTDVKCCSSFFGIKSIASYLQFPPEGSKSFHLPPDSCWTFLDLCLCLRREEIMWPKRRKEVCTGYKMPLEARKGKLIKETGKEFGR